MDYTAKIQQFRKTAGSIGNIIQILHDKQLIILADETSLDKLESHIINRTIDKKWVEKLKLPLLKTIQNKYTFTGFVIGILLEDFNNNNNTKNYRSIILDAHFYFF